MSEVHRPSLLGYSLILFSSVLYGTYGVWSHLMGSSFGPFYQAWVRSIAIILIMLPFMLASKSFQKIERNDWPQVGTFIAFCVFTQVPLYYAFNHAPIGTVQLIFYSVFIIAAYVVGKFYLGETITRPKLASMVIAFAGLAIVFNVSILVFSPLALFLAALNGAASGAETTSSKKVSDKYSPALLIFWGWVFTLATHLPISLIIHEKQVVPQLNAAWFWLLVYSAVSALAFWMSLTGFRYVDASIGSLIGLSEVLFSVLFGALIFHQSLSWTIYLGGILIIIAGMLPDLLNIIKGKHPSEPIEPLRQL